MQSEAIVCEVRYRLDPDKLAEFDDYGHAWVRLIERYGGTHYGFFLPRAAPSDTTISFPRRGQQGETDVAVALYGFPDDAAYRRYRTELPLDPEAKIVIERFAEPPFKSYERVFLQPLSGQL
ncbi:NIPSNAP family protein [Sphingomonas nostoxanthinifaciens]|uniref:NIPSNAP family protein n=1 Tax=Sphingomonas nostoxanthinifaciens TaxID=2872652 RepID=UPI001CC20409|nr:NIPSNAP family protein [Sphingomonas nostoxanthinifaciens]UAK25462.1 NIPSNAP family protein [Sphingomonas nostoxanthinifaciens]